MKNLFLLLVLLITTNSFSQNRKIVKVKGTYKKMVTMETEASLVKYHGRVITGVIKRKKVSC